MIGYDKQLTGRMGNRLFQYHFMRQLAYKMDIGYFNTEIPDNVWFYDMQKNGLSWSLFKKKKRIDSKTILDLGKDNCLNYLESLILDKYHIVLNPPILGDVFFDYLFENPNKFIKIRDEYKNNNFFKNNKIYIALHFRGTDFEAWNKDAILDYDYYHKSIDVCIDYFKNDIVFLLFTDDITLNSYKKSIEYLKHNGLELVLGNSQSSAINDFYLMSECDVVISTPSTFSIWAGILGKDKKIIHSHKWLKNREKVDDKFWIDLKKSTNSIYKLWRTV